MKRIKNKSEVVELQPLVACLKSMASKNIEISKQAFFRLTPKFYHKSGSELRLEEQQRIKLITC